MNLIFISFLDPVSKEPSPNNYHLDLRLSSSNAAAAASASASTSNTSNVSGAISSGGIVGGGGGGPLQVTNSGDIAQPTVT
ncbi:hypothetical protein BLA29_008318 [Euroglyphus maynei]|uniref:Uncharacterized protein n=1 Tax=Euroglyphus maynei TaxID=6958 RepID=A0A1Y3BTA4_EURMA|nr:hypothetical protein BLA29_008318 [Euroglyphus maynei]